MFQYGGGPWICWPWRRRSGQTATPDRTIAEPAQPHQRGHRTTGTVTATSDPNVNRYAFQGEGGRDEHNPTFRIDVNITNNQRVTGTYNYQQAFQHPDLLNGNDPDVPGFANFADQRPIATSGSYTLRSTFGSHVVNELVGGFLWSPIDFAGPLGPDQFVDQGGFNLTLPTLGSAQLTGATITSNMSQRNASHWDINDTSELAEGQPQPVDGRQLHQGELLDDDADGGAVAARSASTPPTIRRTRCSRRRIFPAPPRRT